MAHVSLCVARILVAVKSGGIVDADASHVYSIRSESDALAHVGRSLIRTLHDQFISGYVSSRLFATLRGEEWRKNIMLTAVLFPG